jgi:hypothetical protein
MEKTSVGGVVGFIRIRFVPIHHVPQLPTLIQANHFPITMYMDMMPIIVSHLTHSCVRANHRTPIPVRAKVFARAKRGKVLPTKPMHV